MQKSDGDANPNRRPLLEKSKTISDYASTAHFPGPLFHAVRRPSVAHTSEFDATSSTSASSSSNISSAGDGGYRSFSSFDGDYVYPSFLGPYAARSRVTVKCSSRKSRDEKSLAQLPLRSASIPSNLSGAGGSVVDSSQSARLRLSRHRSRS